MEEDTEQRIHRMSDVLASQVAAGEVVERPASVVKELVENSIDAGAHAVKVEIRRGGVSLIKVTDDGCGMSKADTELCLLRHATSKLTKAEDLFAIRNLGFRGEALPSIASVSNMVITTRRAEDVAGWRISCDGGEMAPLMNAGCAPGTEIQVCNLFYNTPVRRKFLKGEETESGHIEHQLKLHALAFPEVRFTYVKEGQVVFDAPATADLRRRIAEFTGQETAEQLMRVRPTEAPGVRVTGYLMPLSAARRNRRMQFIFLNGRPIEDQIITRAVRDGYGGFPTGLHPALFLYLEVEPALVDVNVHPAKREVRFRRPSEITMAVMQAVAGTLAFHARGGDAAPPAPEPPPAPPKAAPQQPASPRATAAPAAPRPAVKPAVQPLRPVAATPVLRLVPEPQQQDLPLPPARPEPAPAAPPSVAAPAATPAAPVAPPAAAAPAEQGSHAVLPNFRYLGSFHGTYALFENTEGLVLMSPRAARERILFERLAESNRRPMSSQRLLVPELLEMDARDMGIAMEVKPQLEQAGFVLSVFGRNTLRVEAVPAMLPLKETGAFLTDLLQLFTRGEVRLNRSRNPFEPFAVQLARRYAAQEDPAPWLTNPMPLLADLLRCEIPYCTPTGKPTLLPFSRSEIDRRFQAK